MLNKKIKTSQDSDSNVFWITMTDLMLGLVIVFMLLFVFAIMGYDQKRSEVEVAQTKISKLTKKINKLSKTEQVYYSRKFSKELKEVLEKHGIEFDVDSDSADVKISNVELFDLNSSELSENGKKYLDKFFPAYINKLLSNDKINKNLAHIIITGHTDSHTFYGVTTPEMQYMKNMDLSIKRANAVVQYMFQTAYDKKYTSRLTKLIIVEGKSYSEPVLNDDKTENYDKSRRVELQLVFSSQEN